MERIASHFKCQVNLGYFALPASLYPMASIYRGFRRGGDKTLGVALSGEVGAATDRAISAADETSGFAFRVPGCGGLLAIAPERVRVGATSERGGASKRPGGSGPRASSFEKSVRGLAAH
jgi:hypothetical protein